MMPVTFLLRLDVLGDVAREAAGLLPDVVRIFCSVDFFKKNEMLKKRRRGTMFFSHRWAWFLVLEALNNRSAKKPPRWDHRC